MVRELSFTCKSIFTDDRTSLLRLVNGLKYNRSLHKVHIGMSARFGGLPVFPPPKLVTVYNALEEMLKDNFLLKDLTFWRKGNFPYTPRAFIIIPIHGSQAALYLKLNKAGRGRLLAVMDGAGQEATRKEWIDAIITVNDNLEAVYYFLSRNPTLCQI